MEVQAEKTSRNKAFEYHWQTKAARKPISGANQAGYGQLHPIQTPAHAFVSGSSLASLMLLLKRIKKFSQRTSEAMKRQTWHGTHSAGRVPQEGGGVSPARDPFSAPRRRGRLRSTVPAPRRPLAPAPRGAAGSASRGARGCLHRTQGTPRTQPGGDAGVCLPGSRAHPCHQAEEEKGLANLAYKTRAQSSSASCRGFPLHLFGICRAYTQQGQPCPPRAV